MEESRLIKLSAPFCQKRKELENECRRKGKRCRKASRALKKAKADCKYFSKKERDPTYSHYYHFTCTEHEFIGSDPKATCSKTGERWFYK